MDIHDICSIIFVHGTRVIGHTFRASKTKEQGLTAKTEEEALDIEQDVKSHTDPTVMWEGVILYFVPRWRPY